MSIATEKPADAISEVLNSEIFGSICVVGSGSFRLVCQTQQQQLNFSYQNSSYHTVQEAYVYKAETI